MTPLNSPHSVSLSENVNLSTESRRDTDANVKKEFSLFDVVFDGLANINKEDSVSAPKPIGADESINLDYVDSIDSQIKSEMKVEDIDPPPNIRDVPSGDSGVKAGEQVNSILEPHPKRTSNEEQVLPGPYRPENSSQFSYGPVENLPERATSPARQISDWPITAPLTKSGRVDAPELTLSSNGRERAIDESSVQKTRDRSMGSTAPVDTVAKQTGLLGSTRDHTAADLLARTFSDSPLYRGNSKTDEEIRGTELPNDSTSDGHVPYLSRDPVPSTYSHRGERWSGLSPGDRVGLTTDDVEMAFVGETMTPAQTDFLSSLNGGDASPMPPGLSRIEQAASQRILSDRKPGESMIVADNGRDFGGLNKPPVHKSEILARWPLDNQNTMALGAESSEIPILPLNEEPSGRRSSMAPGAPVFSDPVPRTDSGKQRLGDEKPELSQARPHATRPGYILHVDQQVVRSGSQVSGGEIPPETMENSIGFGPQRQMNDYIPSLKMTTPGPGLESVEAASDPKTLRPVASGTGLEPPSVPGRAEKRFETPTLRPERDGHLAPDTLNLSRVGETVSVDLDRPGEKNDNPTPIKSDERWETRGAKTSQLDRAGPREPFSPSIPATNVNGAITGQNGFLRSSLDLQNLQARDHPAKATVSVNGTHSAAENTGPRLKIATESQPTRDAAQKKIAVDHLAQKQNEWVPQNTEQLASSVAATPPAGAEQSNTVMPMLPAAGLTKDATGALAVQVSPPLGDYDIASSLVGSPPPRPSPSNAEQPVNRSPDLGRKPSVRVSENPVRSEQSNIVLPIPSARVSATDHASGPKVPVSLPSNNQDVMPVTVGSSLPRSGVPIVGRSASMPADLALSRPDTANVQINVRPAHQPKPAVESLPGTQSPTATNHQAVTISAGDTSHPVQSPRNTMVKAAMPDKTESSLKYAKSGPADPSQGNPNREQQVKLSDGNQTFPKTGPALANSDAVDPMDLDSKPLTLSQHVMGELGLRGVSAQPTPPSAQPPTPSPTAQILQSFPTTPGQAVEIALSPEELGHLRITLDTSDGSAKLSIVAERGETLDLLRRHSGELSSELRQMGYQTVDFDFSQDKKQQDQTSHQFEDTSDSTETDAPADNTNPADTELSGVDVRV